MERSSSIRIPVPSQAQEREAVKQAAGKQTTHANWISDIATRVIDIQKAGTSIRDRMVQPIGEDLILEFCAELEFEGIEQKIDKAKKFKVAMIVSMVAFSIIAAAAAVALAVMVFAPPFFPVLVGATIAASALTPYILPVILSAAASLIFLANRGRQHYQTQQNELDQVWKLFDDNDFQVWASEQTNYYKIGHIEFYQLYQLLEEKKAKEAIKRDDFTIAIEALAPPVNKETIKAQKYDEDLQKELKKIQDAIDKLEQGLERKVTIDE
jgi:hypothetical protein